jgi:hypothetical protein
MRTTTKVKKTLGILLINYVLHSISNQILSILDFFAEWLRLDVPAKNTTPHRRSATLARTGVKCREREGGLQCE